MRKYRIIFIVCFLIVLGFMLYTFLPQIKVVSNTYNENKEGNKQISQNELRNTNLGERYISEDVKAHNKEALKEKFEQVEHQDGTSPEGTIEKYATPIYGGNAVAKYFGNKSTYYHGEIKLEEAFYNYIPGLLNETVNMTNTELKTYFNNNLALLEKRLGIVSDDAFIRFIGSMDKLKGRKYTKINIPENSVTENYNDMSINFLIELTLEDGTRIAPVSVSISSLKSTANQSVPYIKFTGIYKSQRAE